MADDRETLEQAAAMLEDAAPLLTAGCCDDCYHPSCVAKRIDANEYRRTAEELRTMRAAPDPLAEALMREAADWIVRAASALPYGRIDLTDDGFRLAARLRGLVEEGQ
jgi:hypothetical protein